MYKRARVIALYLPQFHPVADNDVFWGKGFTEWTNVGKAKPLFWGHYQPKVPADLGYYDLRIPETRQAQADMAREYGVEGFCYWHYWFGNGKRLLERPFQEVLSSGKPDFPFCLAWANESWRGLAHGLKNRKVLIEQLYPGVEDYTNHFYAVLPAFRDKRYITVDGKPLFMIFKPLASTEVLVFMDTWRRLATENGLKGIHFVGHGIDLGVSMQSIMDRGFDAANSIRIADYAAFHRPGWRRIMSLVLNHLFGIPRTFPYKKAARYFITEEDKTENIYPSIISGWDHSPRSGKDGIVMSDYTPKQFRKHAAEAIDIVQDKPYERRVVFLKSWNEWAEGNYIEPDRVYGRQFLEALKSVLKNNE